MKYSLTLLALFTVAFTVAQPKVVEKAIIKAKTEITFPENFTPGGPGGGGGGEGMNFTMPRDMETTTTMYYTLDFMKVESMSDSSLLMQKLNNARQEVIPCAMPDAILLLCWDSPSVTISLS